MIPYSYEWVDMGGIDLAEANGTVVDGIYNRIVDAVNACGDAIFYNWKFAGIEIAPSPVSTLAISESILINGIIQVTGLDQVTVLGIEPPLVPVTPLSVVENGIYRATPPQSGFNPVEVLVPPRIPVINQLSVSANGVYRPPEGVDGFGPVNVNVESADGLRNFYISSKAGDYMTGWYQSRTVTRIIDNVKLVPASHRGNSGYVAGTFYSLVNYNLSDVVTGDYLQKLEIDISSVGIGYNTLYAYGGTSGSGNNGTVSIYPSGFRTRVVLAPDVGSNYAHGPTVNEDFGNAFAAMSEALKEEFWQAVLQTI